MVGVILDEGAAFALSVASYAPLSANTFMLLCQDCFSHYSDMWPTLNKNTMLNLKASTTQMTMRRYKCEKCHAELHGIYELHGQRVAMCLSKQNDYSSLFKDLADLE